MQEFKFGPENEGHTTDRVYYMTLPWSQNTSRWYFLFLHPYLQPNIPSCCKQFSYPITFERYSVRCPDNPVVIGTVNSGFPEILLDAVQVRVI